MGDLSKILWEQFEKQNGVDFTFKFVDENDEDKTLDEFGVHSIILTSQSSVFNAMLNGKLKETSPLILKDTKPDIFKKFVSILYAQETAVFSLEEAQSLYYLAAKYDFPKGILIAKKYMLDNIDFTNVTSVYECAQLFDDKDLKSANWEFLEKFILKTMKGLECLGGQPFKALDEYSFEVMNSPESAKTLKALKSHVQEIHNQPDVKKKVGYAIGLIKTLIEEIQKTFRLIVPTGNLSIAARLQRNSGVLSNFEKLNRLFNEDAKCMFCSTNHQLVNCTQCGFAAIYQKYKHDDLTFYNIEDINGIYNQLKARLPA